ncbi:hypothetical protein [Burkholderia gladioli]|uniref:hypothetical protein n=1 Tax=Burkholderia gladioli TaxID=28095 RepID=UPI001640B930|nr:hypothetical protein [Burkholderia gladioli]
MAKVSLTLTSEVEIGRVDQIMTVKTTDGRSIGKLKFSKGSVEWWPKGNKVNAHKYSWEKFAETLEGAQPKQRMTAKTPRKATTKSPRPATKRIRRTVKQDQ